MTKVTTTLQISNCDLHPLMVNVTLNTHYENGWCWEVEQINYVELVIGDKVGIDITRQVLADKQATAIITACAADQEEQIYEALAGEKERVA